MAADGFALGTGRGFANGEGKRRRVGVLGGDGVFAVEVGSAVQALIGSAANGPGSLRLRSPAPQV